MSSPTKLAKDDQGRWCGPCRTIGRECKATHRHHPSTDGPPTHLCRRHAERCDGRGPPGLCGRCWSVGLRSRPATYSTDEWIGFCDSCRSELISAYGEQYGEPCGVCNRNDLAVTAIAVRPDGNQVCWAVGKVLVVCSYKGGHPPQHLFDLKGHKKKVTGVAYSPDGSWILSASHDGTTRLWDSSTGLLIKTTGWKAGPLTAVAFSPDGLKAIVGTEGNMLIGDIAPVE